MKQLTSEMMVPHMGLELKKDQMGLYLLTNQFKEQRPEK